MRKLRSMTRRKAHETAPVLLALLIPGVVSGRVAGEPPQQVSTGYEAYIDSVESRLALQHRSAAEFLISPEDARLRGEAIVERLTADGASPPGALLHHWRGTAFVPGAKVKDFERLLRDFDHYPESFAPQVLEARTLAQDGDRVQAWMRVSQRHGLTVTLDTTYDVSFGRLDAAHGYSASRSVRIAQIEPAGRAFDGLLWRQNTYWSWEERDGGLYLQIESVSLTRSIPRGLGWAIGPFVESVPREELEFTLRSACDALRRSKQ
jgi:hypothetical protein